MPFASYHRLVIHFPLNPDLPPLPDPMTPAALAEACPELDRVIGLLTADQAVGRMGAYVGVYELGRGTEGFMPGPEANPQLGEAWVRSSVASLVLKTYLRAGDPALEPFIQKVVGLHRWEHPVIEIFDVMLWEPPAA